MSIPYARFIYPVAFGLLLILNARTLRADAFGQTNLVSSVPGLAPATDANLKNPWGVSFSATSPFWVSNQLTNTSTLYSGTGAAQSLVVTVPGGPTGQVFAGASGFTGPSGSPNFVFATLSGSIYAWNAASGTTAQLAGGSPGAVYTGLALGTASGSNFLYAANSVGGIDVYNSSFSKVPLAGTFTDPTLPSGFTPYNIQNINGSLYVEYANSSATGASGIISVFDTNGNFQRRLVSSTGVLDDPWGIVVAPASWGTFANALLVGNEGNGRINAFSQTNGAFLGTLTDSFNNPIVNDGLWALSTRTGPGFDPNAVYFAAGINNETDGLFGRINPVPEPVSVSLLGLGGLAVALVTRRGRRRSES